MTVLAKDESERLERIERGIQYGVTYKDLFWLVRLVRRLEKKCQLADPPSPYLPLGPVIERELAAQRALEEFRATGKQPSKAAMRALRPK